MSFEEYMKSSNAEYRKIRTLYLKTGGGVARDYDAELLAEVQANKVQIDRLDDYVVTLDYDEMAEIEEMNAQAANVETENAENAKESAETPKYRVESIVLVGAYSPHYKHSVGYTNKRNVPMERSADYFFMAHYGVVINQVTGEIEYNFGCKNVLDGYFKSLPYTAEADCLEDYIVYYDAVEAAANAETDNKSAEKEPKLIDKLRAKVKEQRERRRSGIDWEATFADMELEKQKQIEEERKKLASIKAQLKDRRQILKDAIKNAVDNEDIYWKYAERAKKQVSGWLKMYRDCLKSLANYRTKLAAQEVRK